MIIIAFEPKGLLGGYGDRVVGLVACKAMSDLLGRDFRIRWTKEDVSAYIDYTKYAAPSEQECAPCYTYDCIDRQTALKEQMMTAADSSSVFTQPTVKFYLNQEIAQYLYANPIFQRASTDYYTDMFAIYKSLYTDILKPTPSSLARIDSICGDHTRIIGIQIRTGDVYIKNNAKYNPYKAIDDVPSTVRTLLTNIKAHMDQGQDDTTTYSVFITSDYDDIRPLAETVWPADRILYNSETAQHIDRPMRGECSKFYVDSYILSQRTTRLYVSDYSNYGCISALSARHDDLWDLHANPLNKTLLLSKHDRMFTA